MPPTHCIRTVPSVVLAASALLATMGCAPPTSPPPGSDPEVYVGAVTGTDAVLAIAVRDRDVAAYVCGGASSFATMTHWFTGALPSAGAPVELGADGFTLRATVAADGASGTLLDAQGGSHAFTAAPRRAGTLAGLYTVVDDGCRTGVVIIQPSGTDAPTVQGTWCALAGAERFEQVIPIMPVSLVDGALRVQVQLASGARTLAAAPVELPLR